MEKDNKENETLPEAQTEAKETSLPKDEAKAAQSKDEAKAAQSKDEAKADEAKAASVLGGKTIEEVIRREAVEESPHHFSIARTLGGVIVARYVQRQMGVVLLTCFFIVCYISNRYICQKKIVEIDKLETKIVKAKFKATVCTSELTEKSRESNVMTLLKSYGDSTLTIPHDPPYLIKVPE